MDHLPLGPMLMLFCSQVCLWDFYLVATWSPCCHLLRHLSGEKDCAPSPGGPYQPPVTSGRLKADLRNQAYSACRNSLLTSKFASGLCPLHRSFGSGAGEESHGPRVRVQEEVWISLPAQTFIYALAATTSTLGSGSLACEL